MFSLSSPAYKHQNMFTPPDTNMLTETLINLRGSIFFYVYFLTAEATSKHQPDKLLETLQCFLVKLQFCGLPIHKSGCIFHNVATQEMALVHPPGFWLLNPNETLDSDAAEEAWI